MKRIFLFIATNLAVVVLLTIVLSALGVDRFLTENGLDLQMLLAFSLIVGFSGSIFSLLISKPMAKWSTGARVIEQPEGAHEQWLVATVRRLADKANIGMPEVAVFEGAPNAFATAWSIPSWYSSRASSASPWTASYFAPSAASGQDTMLR